MSWRDNLRPASFRGVPFKIQGHSSDVGGRRLQVHEYPGRDDPYPEDLGRKTREFSIDGYVIGDDYMRERDALIDACNKAGPGTLVHPYLGTLSVVCSGCQVTERTEDGRMARLSLSFTDAGENRFPAASADTAKVVDLAATDAVSKISADFADSFSVDGLPAFVADDATGIVEKASSAILAIGSLSTAGAIVRGAASLVSGAIDLVRNPALLASELTGFIGNAALSISPAADAVKGIKGLAAFGADLAAVPLTTATRIAQAANQTALCSMVRRAGIVEAARLAPTLSFAYQQEAFDLRDDLGTLLDGEMATSSDSVYGSLARVRTTLVKDLNMRAPGLARLVQATTHATEPALVTAYRLYEDADRADEIVARNRLRHPGFVQGGGTLEVLSRV